MPRVSAEACDLSQRPIPPKEQIAPGVAEPPPNRNTMKERQAATDGREGACTNQGCEGSFGRKRSGGHAKDSLFNCNTCEAHFAPVPRANCATDLGEGGGVNGCNGAHYTIQLPNPSRVDRGILTVPVLVDGFLHQLSLVLAKIHNQGPYQPPKDQPPRVRVDTRPIL